MEIKYLVYAACAVFAGLGYWLLLPVRSRLLIINKGKKGAGKLERYFRKERELLVERIGKSRKEREMHEAMSFLRNLIAVDMSGRMSADMVIQRLSESRGILQPVYLKTLRLLRMNRRVEAEKYFADAVGGRGRDFVRILVQWDEIEPRELASTLISYQKSLKESRITAKKKKDEMISDLIYVPVVVNVMVIFMNFIYVAYFVEQKEIFSQMFM